MNSKAKDFSARPWRQVFLSFYLNILVTSNTRLV